MSFRVKLAIVVTLTIVVAVALVAWGVSTFAERQYESVDQKHTDALVKQFQREFDQRGGEVADQVTGIAEAEATLKMAIELNGPKADASKYVEDATGLAGSHHLDFLDFIGDDGSLISSKEWAARFGYKTDWVIGPGTAWNNEGAFLQRMDLPEGVALSLTVVRVVPVGEKKLYVVGGVQLDKKFLTTLVLPEGIRALFYSNLDSTFNPPALTDVNGPVPQADRLAALINRVRAKGMESSETIQWTSDPSSAENFHADPRMGRGNQLLGVLLVGSSRRDLVSLVNFIRTLGVLVGAVGILLGVLLSAWVSARVTRPIARLAAGAREVAAGDWAVRVDVRSHDEVGQLARDFNHMTQQLAEQRDRLVQAERVAAWREIARRLAHELKNPLFPLQLTLENLQRAREQTPEQFDEVFKESIATLRSELDNMKTIVGRFSDFSKMPTPQLQSVNLNESVRNAVRLFDAQFNVSGRPPINPELYLDESVPLIQADPDLLHRALSNLVLNSLDAMPAGGTLTIRTGQKNGTVRVDVTDTGTGLTPEECERLFTPYYTTKRHGTGLGLAIVQAVVSDHHGKISVESTPGTGATFRIELPIRPPSDEENPVAGRGSDKDVATRDSGRGSSRENGRTTSPDAQRNDGGVREADIVKELDKQEPVRPGAGRGGTKSTLGLND